MSSLRQYFEAEAAGYFRQLSEVTATDDLDAGSLHRLARGLRGTAQIARQDHVYHAAVGFEAAARALASNAATWDEDARRRIRHALDELRTLADAPENAADRDDRLAAVLDWCRPLGGRISDQEPQSDQPLAEARAFREYVAAESAGIAGVLEESTAAFLADPNDRTPLRAVLRRQAPLLGAARLDDVPAVGETLRAVEDISAIIARLEIPVKKEWLDVFRCARDVLRSASHYLQQGEDPVPISALSRVRTLHQELVDRYGTLERRATPKDGEPTRISVAAPPELDAPDTEPTARDPRSLPAMEIDELCYSGADALRRALELRAPIERAVAHDPVAQRAIVELFDLIRMALE